MPGCANRAHVVGWALCPAHYSRLQRWGDVRADLPLGGPSREERFWAKVDKCGPDECWVWTAAKSHDGYGMFNHPLRFAHRVAYSLVIGPVPPFKTGVRVLHHCDNPPCVNPDHLYLGTQKDNARDRSLRGRDGGESRRGEANGSAKLTRFQVDEIRQRVAAGLRYGERKALCEEFGIGTSTYYRIVRGTHWK